MNDDSIILETPEGGSLRLPSSLWNKEYEAKFDFDDDALNKLAKATAKKEESEEPEEKETPYKGKPLKFFKMIRNHDIHKTSGTGHIIDGVIFSNGQVVVHWRTEHSSIVIYNNYEDFEKIHISGHDANKTEVHWYYPDMSDKELEAETLAKRFHKIYEAKAEEFDYETKDETSVPWSELPDNNKQLMLAVCKKIIDEFGLTDRGRS